MDADTRAGRLAEIGQELAWRIREYDPADVHRWLAQRMGDGDWMGLAIVLAAAVDVDRPWLELTGWVPSVPDPQRVARRRLQWREATRRRRERAA